MARQKSVCRATPFEDGWHLSRLQRGARLAVTVAGVIPILKAVERFRSPKVCDRDLRAQNRSFHLAGTFAVTGQTAQPQRVITAGMPGKRTCITLI